MAYQEKEKRNRWDGDKIRALRSHLKLTQNEMAEQLGTRQQTISEWEKGMYQPRGASSRLLSIVAEDTGFRYDAGSDGERTEAGDAR